MKHQKYTLLSNPFKWFDLTDNRLYAEIGENRVKVFQIQALTKMYSPTDEVIALPGDVGGWVEGEHNLSQLGLCWLGERAVVVGRARVSGNAQVKGDAVVKDSALVSGDAKVTGTSLVFGHGVVTDKAFVENTRVSGRVCDEAHLVGGFVLGSAAVGATTLSVEDAPLYVSDVKGAAPVTFVDINDEDVTFHVPTLVVGGYVRHVGDVISGVASLYGISQVLAYNIVSGVKSGCSLDSLDVKWVDNTKPLTNVFDLRYRMYDEYEDVCTSCKSIFGDEVFNGSSSLDVLKYRIDIDGTVVAARDIPSKGVLKGDRGGTVDSYINLSQNGTAWIFPEAHVGGQFGRVKEDAEVRGPAELTNTFLSGDAVIFVDTPTEVTKATYKSLTSVPARLCTGVAEKPQNEDVHFPRIIVPRRSVPDGHRVPVNKPDEKVKAIYIVEDFIKWGQLKGLTPLIHVKCGSLGSVKVDKYIPFSVGIAVRPYIVKGSPVAELASYHRDTFSVLSTAVTHFAEWLPNKKTGQKRQVTLYLNGSDGEDCVTFTYENED